MQPENRLGALGQFLRQLDLDGDRSAIGPDADEVRSVAGRVRSLVIAPGDLRPTSRRGRAARARR